MTLTRQDARTVRAAASALEHTDERMVAKHLAPKLLEVADKIEHEAFLHEEVVRAFSEPVEVR